MESLPASPPLSGAGWPAPPAGLAGKPAIKDGGRATTVKECGETKVPPTHLTHNK